MLQTVADYFRVSLKVAEYFRLLQSTIECCRVFLSVAVCCRLLQSTLECYRLPPKRSFNIIFFPCDFHLQIMLSVMVFIMLCFSLQCLRHVNTRGELQHTLD